MHYDFLRDHSKKTKQQKAERVGSKQHPVERNR